MELDDSTIHQQSRIGNNINIILIKDNIVYIIKDNIKDYIVYTIQSIY